MPRDIKVNEATLNLHSIENGKWVRISGFDGGHGLEQKLRQIGVMPGDIIRVLRQAPFGGPVLIEIKGREFALSSEVAAHILVSEATGCASL